MIFASTRATAPLWIAVAALALCQVGGVAHAQQPSRPGPMQSGPHASAPAPATPVAAASAPTDAAFDPRQLFANVCGWCHSSGGREAGKGPKLMGSVLTDGELAYRIKAGKTGQMPAFGSALNEQQIAAVVAYIRNLKSESSQ